MQLTKERAAPWNLDRWIEEFWKPSFALFPQSESFVPNFDFYEGKEGFTVQVELPGLTPKDVQVEIDGNLLTIRGEKKWEDEKKERQYHRIERRYGSFIRQITLPESADIGKANAVHKDGLLTITFPKKDEAKKKTIPVK
jgi:HSP20 family protein